MDKLTRADSQETQKRILETFAKDLPITNRLHWLIEPYLVTHFFLFTNFISRTITGSVRFCFKCMLIKPDRAHHCSVCGTCVLKMDHHCPWVGFCCFYSCSIDWWKFCFSRLITASTLATTSFSFFSLATHWYIACTLLSHLFDILFCFGRWVKAEK